MCVVSNVGDHYGRKWLPYVQTTQPIPIDGTVGWPSRIVNVPPDEWDNLRAEFEECIELLRAAKRIDEITNQPNCEDDAKFVVIHKIADALGVDLDELLQS